MHKSKFLALTLTLTLAACSGGHSSACVNTFWNGEIGTCLPDGWEIMDAESLAARGVPDDVITVFRKKVSIAGQYPAVAVTKERLLQQADPAVYSDSSMKAVEVLPGYTLIDTKDVEMDGGTVKIHSFNVQPVDSEPAKRFYQLSSVNGDFGYTISAAAPLAVGSDIEHEMIAIVEHFTFTEPE